MKGKNKGTETNKENRMKARERVEKERKIVKADERNCRRTKRGISRGVCARTSRTHGSSSARLICWYQLGRSTAVPFSSLRADPLTPRIPWLSPFHHRRLPMDDPFRAPATPVRLFALGLSLAIAWFPDDCFFLPETEYFRRA